MNSKKEMGPILFNPHFSYTRKVPTLVANTVQGSSEIARWVLDSNQILHVEKDYGPVQAVKKVNKLSGSDGTHNNPVLIHNDSLVYSAESIIKYYDQQVPEERQLFPEDPSLRDEVWEWFDLFTNTLNQNVWQYMYSELLIKKKYALHLLKQKVGLGAKLRYSFFYGFTKRAIEKEWGLDGQDSIVYLVEVEKIFARVSAALSDGRKFLVGDRFTACDMAFAAISAPLVVPEEFGGAIARMNHVGEELRLQMVAMRATPAGQYALRLYQENRAINLDLGPIPKKSGVVKRLSSSLLIRLTSNKGSLFYFLQKHLPVLKLGPFVAVSRHDLVVQLLDRNLDFTVRQINAKKFANQKGTFFLAMDSDNPQFERERNFARNAARREDLTKIRSFIREQAKTITKEVAPLGKLDVVQRLNMLVMVRLIDAYFGVPPPVESEMEKWNRTMFFDLFLNFTNNKKKHQEAVKSGQAREAWVRGLISKRKAILDSGGTLSADNMLNRMILMSRQPEYLWVDDDCIRRQIGGLLTGFQAGTSKAVVLVLQELFKRPAQLKGAIEAANQAYKSEDKMKVVAGYCYEALRFNPVQPGVLRYCEAKQFLRTGTKKTYTIKANKTIMALTSGAMFDPITWPDPKVFKPDRESRYMNWGFGLHECYGRHINQVSIPELVTAVLRLPNVKRGRGAAGRGAGLKDGPFPNNYVVAFDPSSTETTNTNQ